MRNLGMIKANSLGDGYACRLMMAPVVLLEGITYYVCGRNGVRAVVAMMISIIMVLMVAV